MTIALLPDIPTADTLGCAVRQLRPTGEDGCSLYSCVVWFHGVILHRQLRAYGPPAYADLVEELRSAPTAWDVLREAPAAQS